MCNPRKVMIYLNRCIQESWQHTVEQCARVSGEVGEMATIQAQINLGAEMGEPALRMLERVLAGEFEGFEPWQRDEQGRFFRQLEQVRLVYTPGSASLSIEAGLTRMLSAEARATAQAAGMTVGQVAVEAVGNYYSDSWGGRTRERATEEAQKLAEQRLAEAIQNLHLQQHAHELQQAQTQAQAAAQAQAQQQLATLQQEARLALRERLQSILAQHQEQVNHIMYRAVGEAYRQTLRQLVLDNGGRIIQDQQTGSVINLEMELY